MLCRKEIRACDAVICQLAGAVAEVCSELCVSVAVVSLSDVAWTTSSKKRVDLFLCGRTLN